MDPMDAIKATYFQECDELLGDLERGLLALEEGSSDADTVNAVFRAVHSVKGGAGAFGFDDLVAFSHVFETALDDVRSGKLEPAITVVRIMLRAADVLSDLVAAAKTGATVDTSRSDALAAELRSLSETGAPPVVAETLAIDAAQKDEWGFAPVKFDFGDEAPSAPAGDWRLSMRPTPVMYANGHDAYYFLRELKALGATQVDLDETNVPRLADLGRESALLAWTVTLPAATDENAIRAIFDFVGDDCPIELTQHASALTTSDLPIVLPEPDLMPANDADVVLAAAVSELREVARSEPKAAAAPQAGATIRVDLDRVDRLIDLVGELVINQAMLAQRVSETGASRASSVAIGLDELEHLTREIQDSVMAIRAQPVRSVFQRMPRLVREISASTGKSVRLITEGEATEVDKTVIERLSDPITHMLRNAIDHGLEKPEARRAAGKDKEGTVRLAAFHRSGRIVIEVSDDGRGIDRARVREIAVAKGLVAPDAQLSDEEIDNLIFLPGFSTATSVSNISGRGVGMDVVKRSIQALGGRIVISSRPGLGSTFTLSLPLTLAVLDGMVVTVGEQTLVSPITAILESLRPRPADIRPIGPSRAVLAVRGTHVPLIDIGVALGWRKQAINPAEGVVLLVESEIGGQAAIVADAIQGQRQVVIKSLEANYQHVDGVAAATILGDGRVALILDIDAIIEAQSLTPAEPALAKAS